MHADVDRGQPFFKCMVTYKSFFAVTVENFRTVIPKGVDIRLQEIVIYESELVITYRGWLLQEMVGHGGLNVLLFIIAQYFIIIFYQNNGL